MRHYWILKYTPYRCCRPTAPQTVGYFLALRLLPFLPTHRLIMPSAPPPPRPAARAAPPRAAPAPRARAPGPPATGPPALAPAPAAPPASPPLRPRTSPNHVRPFAQLAIAVAFQCTLPLLIYDAKVRLRQSSQS